MHVVVIGAGVFGSWTALWLRRRGATVTLVDQYGPGNSLSSSGDESRVTRSAHGSDEHYPLWQRRSLSHWTDLAPELFDPTGVLWFAHRDDGFEADSAVSLERLLRDAAGRHALRRRQRPHMGGVRRRLLRAALDRGPRVQGRARLARTDGRSRSPGTSDLG